MTIISHGPQKAYIGAMIVFNPKEGPHALSGELHIRQYHQKVDSIDAYIL